MSLRKNLLVCSSLLAITLIGMSPVASADEGLPIVQEDCIQATVVRRNAGHPGKSLMLPNVAYRKSANCSVEKRKPLMLAGYTDSRGGRALVNGRTEQAVKQLNARRSARLTADELTNLCVAQTKLKQWSEASDTCDAAVGSALDAARSRGPQELVVRKLANTKVAVAYSNRAVMYRLTGDAVAAHNDLAKARNFSPKASFVVRNLEVAGIEPALASVVP